MQNVGDEEFEMFVERDVLTRSSNTEDASNIRSATMSHREVY